MATTTILTVGCFSDHGGVIITGDPLLMINGRAVARVGDLHSCPLFWVLVPHAITPIIASNPCPYRPNINGRLAAISGDTTGCGARILPCLDLGTIPSC